MQMGEDKKREAPYQNTQEPIKEKIDDEKMQMGEDKKREAQYQNKVSEKDVLVAGKDGGSCAKKDMDVEMVQEDGSAHHFNTIRGDRAYRR